MHHPDRLRLTILFFFAMVLIWGMRGGMSGPPVPIVMELFSGYAMGASPTPSPTPSRTPTGTPLPPATATATIPPPNIITNPTTLEEVHSNAPQVTTDTLVIENRGALPLIWNIVESDGTEPDRALMGPVVQDGSFETGTPNNSWDEFSTTPRGTPLCDNHCVGAGGDPTHTGTWWAWFGGAGKTSATSAITQTVAIPAGAAELRFWLKIPTREVDGYFVARMDGTEVFRVEEDTPGYNTYTYVEVDISEYADGASHELSFLGFVDEGYATSFFLDDVEIQPLPGGACSAPTAISWVTLNPMNGNTVAGGMTPVILTYDSAGLGEDTYTGTLCISSNDPFESIITVPLTLVVGGPTAIDLGSFQPASASVPLFALVGAGLLLLMGLVVLGHR